MEEERYARVQKSNGTGVFIKWEVVNSKTADKAVTKKGMIPIPTESGCGEWQELKITKT